MDLNLAAFEANVSSHLGCATVDARLRQAVATVCRAEPDEATGLTFEQAAEALLLAVLGGHPIPTLANLTLSSASGKCLVLPPAQAKAHLLAKEWIGDNPILAVAQALRIGADMVDESGEPQQSNITITEARGEVLVCAFTQDGGLSLFAFYGPTLDQSALHAVTRIDTATLRAIGFCARSQTTVMAPLEANPLGFGPFPNQFH